MTVTANYTGANAEVCTKAVATPLERAINGVPGMTYMSSVCSNDGLTVITINFNVGVDPDQAAVSVQNRVATILDELPEEVIRAGVGAGEFRPVDPTQFIPSMVALVLFYFTSAPIMKAAAGFDPLSPERVAARRAAVLDFVSAALFRPVENDQ